MIDASAIARRRHFAALGALLLANVFWGLSFPLIKATRLAHESIDPSAGGWFVTAMTVAPRFVFAMVVIALALGWRAGSVSGAWSGIGRREWRQGIILGLFASGGMLFQNDGLHYTHASTSAFLTQLYAVLIPLWVAARARRWPSSVVWVAIVLVFLGTAVLARLDPREFHLGRGEAETLLSSLFFAGQILVLSRPDFATNRALPITFVMFATESVVFVAMAGILAPDAAALVLPFRSGAWIGCTAVLTVFCTLGAFMLMNTFQPRISATEAGLIYCIEPVFGAALALFLPAWLSAWGGFDYANETLTTALFLGGALISAANLVLQLRPPPPPER